MVIEQFVLHNLHLINTYDEFIKKYHYNKNVIEAQIAHETIKNKLIILKKYILKNKLTPKQLKNFNEKFNELYNVGNLDFRTKKI